MRTTSSVSFTPAPASLPLSDELVETAGGGKFDVEGCAGVGEAWAAGRGCCSPAFGVCEVEEADGRLVGCDVRRRPDCELTDAGIRIVTAQSAQEIKFRHPRRQAMIFLFPVFRNIILSHNGERHKQFASLNRFEPSVPFP